MLKPFDLGVFFKLYVLLLNTKTIDIIVEFIFQAKQLTQSWMCKWSSTHDIMKVWLICRMICPSRVVLVIQIIHGPNCNIFSPNVFLAHLSYCDRSSSVVHQLFL